MRGSSLDCIQLLTDHGADITAFENARRNALQLLITCSNEYEWMRSYSSGDFQLILKHERGTYLVGKKDNAGATPLHHALRNQQLWAVEPLLTEGANPLMLDPEKNSALHYLATQFTHPESDDKYFIAVQLFQRFLELGVDINARNKAGETPIFNLVSGPGYLEHVQMFEQKESDMEVKNLKGQGLLHMVAKVGRVDVFTYLMNKGLDAMAENDENRSALDVACAGGNGSKGILEIFRQDM